MKKNFIFETLLIIFLGSLTSLSLPPYNFFFLNFFTFSVFFIFLFHRLKQGIKKSFYYGWLFGFSYFLSSLYWLTISLSFDQSFNFLIPISLIVIPAFLGLFYALCIAIFYLYKPKNILSAFFLFSLLFGLIEFIRGTILTGFPWNLVVYSFSEINSFLSILSIIGTYSLNLIVVSFFTAPALFIFRKSKKEGVVCIFLLLLPISFYTYGEFLKKNFYNSKEKELPFAVRVIGANISLDRYYKNVNAESVINELISISSPIEEKKTFFVWPEGIIPNTYEDQLDLYNDIFEKYFSENHLIGLGITSRKTMNNDYNYYNSFSIFDSKVNLIDNYNKIKLVPFGEFVPIEKILNKFGLKTITNNIGSFDKGVNRKIIKIQGDFKQINFLPLICYEIIYSGNLTKNFDFDFILNISEDGWFGKSIGPKQHFIHSKFRAVENGKYIIRSSNNGMAAIINPLGYIENKIEYGISGYIDLEGIRDLKPTLFSKYGNNIFFILILLYIVLTFSFNRIKNE